MLCGVAALDGSTVLRRDWWDGMGWDGVGYELHIIELLLLSSLLFSQ